MILLTGYIDFNIYLSIMLYPYDVKRNLILIMLKEEGLSRKIITTFDR